MPRFAPAPAQPPQEHDPYSWCAWTFTTIYVLSGGIPCDETDPAQVLRSEEATNQCMTRMALSPLSYAAFSDREYERMISLGIFEPVY